jgi:hypothetical protein
MEYLPVWPHPDYAQRATDLHFPGNLATEISLAEFMDDWLSKVAEGFGSGSGVP